MHTLEHMMPPHVKLYTAVLRVPAQSRGSTAGFVSQLECISMRRQHCKTQRHPVAECLCSSSVRNLIVGSHGMTREQLYQR
jgi:hypothetical protein